MHLLTNLLIHYFNTGTRKPTYQHNFPEEEEDFLDGEVRCISTAELGDHGEKHYSKAIITRHRQHCTTDTHGEHNLQYSAVKHEVNERLQKSPHK